MNGSGVNGFGLQHIGLLALRAPVIATILVIAISLVAGIGLSRLQFSGENIEILRDGSQELRDYDELLSEFRNFNNDAVILMRLENLATVEGMEIFRELNFEFTLDERVETVLSVFSLVRYAGPDIGWESALPATFESDEQVKEALIQMVEDIPSSQSLFSPNFDSAVMVVYATPEATRDENVQDTMQYFEDLADEFEERGIEMSIAGQPAIRSDIIHSIVSDVSLLAPIAILMCAILALFLFRHPVAMVMCALPSLLAIFWFLGGVGLAGIPLNFLTNILPVLLIVVIFADTLHLFLKWQKIEETDQDHMSAAKTAIKLIGPACALSSVTTAAALLSLCFSGNNGLYQLGIMGALGVLCGFVCLMLLFPVSVYWVSRLNIKMGKARAYKMARIASPAVKLVPFPKPAILVGLVLSAVGIYAHFNIDNRFRLIDYLASDSEVGQSEDYIDEAYSGTTPLFAIVDLDTSIPIEDDANQNRVYATTEASEATFGETGYYSIITFVDEIKRTGGQLDSRLLDEVPRFLANRFISEDYSKVLVTIFSSANYSASEMRERLAVFQSELDKRDLGDIVRVTGYPVLSGVVAPRLMDNLRISLLLAVLLSITIIAVAARSLRLGLCCLIPNLLPIVSVELILFIADIPLNMSITVALTVAFGIAVDDTIHLLNQYMQNREKMDFNEAMTEALKEVTPAIFSTTLILSGGLVIMCFSSLPAMAVFSLVVILTLVFAFIADIFQLPAYLRIGEKNA